MLVSTLELKTATNRQTKMSVGASGILPLNTTYESSLDVTKHSELFKEIPESKETDTEPNLLDSIISES